MLLVEVYETNVEMIVDNWETNENLSPIAHNEEDVEEVELSDDKAEIQGDVKCKNNAKKGEAVNQDKNFLKHKFSLTIYRTLSY